MLRITDVTYLVRDLDEAITFLVDVVGFTVRSDEPRPGGGRRVVVGPDSGGPGLVLKVSDSPTVGRQAGAGVAFFLHTDDFAGIYERLLARGVTMRGPVRHEEWGTVVVFDDPYGNGWDLIEPPTRATE